MSKLWVLTKILIKNNLSSLGKNKKGKMPPYLTAVLLVAIFGLSFGVPLGAMFSGLYDMLAPIAQQGALLTLVLAAISITVFIFGIFYVLSIFYFAKDVEILLPLPLNPSQILGAKFLSVLIYEYLTELVILTPAIVVFAAKGSVGILFYLYSVLIFLLMPIIPLIFASLINMVIMRFTNIGKHKDALRIIGGLLAVSFGVGINMITQNMSKVSQDKQFIIDRIISGNNSLVGVVSKIFPPAKFASLSIIESDSLKGLINFILFLVISLAFIAIFFVVAEALYFKGVLGNAEVYSKRKKLSGEQLDKNVKQNSALKAFTLKELRILLRTPAYVMNCVISSFMWPIFLAIGVFSSGSIKELQAINLDGFINDPKVLGIILAIIFGVAVMLSGSSGIASTSISREGQNLFVSKYIPLKFKDQIWARIIPGMIFSSISIIITLVLVYALVGIPTVIIIPGIIVIVLAMLLTSFIGILFELKFPKLNWDNEQRAVKQNMNFVITMFGSWAVTALSIFLIVKSGLQMWYVFSIIVAVCGLIDLALYYVIMNVGQKWFDKVEV